MHAVVAAVHRRAHQLVEAGIDQHKVVAAGILGGAHGAQQYARFGHQVAARLQLQPQVVAHQRLGLLARRIPEAKVVLGVDGGIALLVGDGQAAAGRDGLQAVAGRVGALHQLHHRAADFLQVAVVHARADVHVQTHQLQAALGDDRQRHRQVAVPDAVLAVLATGIGLVAVAMAEAGVDAQPDRMAGRCLAQLVQHVDGAGIDGDFVLDHGGQRGLVHHIGGEHDVGRLAKTALVAGRQRAQHFAARDRIDLDALRTHQLQHMDVGAGLLGKAHRIKSLQLCDALADGVRVIHPQRGVEVIGQLPQQIGGKGVAHSRCAGRRGIRETGNRGMGDISCPVCPG